jgi:hypothetical protein
MSYSPSQLNPKISRQIASNPSQQINILVDTMLEASYAYNLEDTPEGFNADVISGFRTGESTGAGSDWTDARLIDIAGELYLEVLVKSKAGKGLTSPDPRDTDLSPAQVDVALQACEWARSSTVVTGQTSPPNFGDIVECFYEKGAVKNSNFNGLRFKSNVLTPQQLEEIQAGGGLGGEGGLGGQFGKPLSPMALAALGSDSGKITDTAKKDAWVKELKSVFANKVKQTADGNIPAEWHPYYNMVGIRDASVVRPGDPNYDGFNDYLVLCYNKAYEPYSAHYQDISDANLKDPAVTEDWDVFKWKITTKGGTKYLKGTGVKDSKFGKGRLAIFGEGQAKGSHKKRCHRCYKSVNGQTVENPPGYTALGQARSVMTYHDNNFNDVHDYINLSKQNRALNIHKAGGAKAGDGSSASKVKGSSMGCQVFKNVSDFNLFMDILQYGIQGGDKSMHARYGKPMPNNNKKALWTYTLVLQEDINWANIPQ